MRGGPMSLEPGPHAPTPPPFARQCARWAQNKGDSAVASPFPITVGTLSWRSAATQSAHLPPHPTPLDFTRTHTNTCAAAPPKVNFIETPDLPGRTLGESVIHSAPPPSPSTPSSVTPRPTWESYRQSEPLQGGASGSGAQKNDDAFGDEATNAIAELNTPSPTLPLKRKVRSRSTMINVRRGVRSRRTLPARARRRGPSTLADLQPSHP